MTDLENEFHKSMIGIYEEAKEVDYLATYFKQMLDRYGGVETAKRLLAKPGIQSGLMTLWEKKRHLNISVEATVFRPRF